MTLSVVSIGAGIIPRMAKKSPADRLADLPPVVIRILRKIEQTGQSRRAVSLKAGYNADLIAEYIKNPATLPRLDTLERLAPILETTPEYLAFNISEGEGGGGGLPIRGEVAAGRWLEVDSYTVGDAYDAVPVQRDPRYPASAQYGLTVRGTSINRVAQDGEVLHCVDLVTGGVEPRDGDLVVAQLKRFQGGEVQVTAKRYRKRAKLIELSPDSTDPRWQEAMTFDPRRKVDDLDVSIVAVVIGIYKPLKR